MNYDSFGDDGDSYRSNRRRLKQILNEIEVEYDEDGAELSFEPEEIYEEPTPMKEKVGPKPKKEARWKRVDTKRSFLNEDV